MTWVELNGPSKSLVRKSVTFERCDSSIRTWSQSLQTRPVPVCLGGTCRLESRVGGVVQGPLPLVLGFLRRRCGDSATAEDLAQETFYRATQAFLGWRGESPAGWLLAIARNVLIDDVRRERPTLPLKDPLDNQVEKPESVSYTHLRAHETKANLVCRLLLEKK